MNPALQTSLFNHAGKILMRRWKRLKGVNLTFKAGSCGSHQRKPSPVAADIVKYTFVGNNQVKEGGDLRFVTHRVLLEIKNGVSGILRVVDDVFSLAVNGEKKRTLDSEGGKSTIQVEGKQVVRAI